MPLRTPRVAQSGACMEARSLCIYARFWSNRRDATFAGHSRQIFNPRGPWGPNGVSLCWLATWRATPPPHGAGIHSMGLEMIMVGR